ncbi:MAG: hypothetical protein AAFW75_15930 [Cyanobacteria bacterium J06636_16]
MKKLFVFSVAIAVSMTWPIPTAKAVAGSDLIPIQSRTCPAMLGEEMVPIDVEARPAEAEQLPVPFLPDDVVEDIQSIELLCNLPRYGLDEIRESIPPSPPVEQEDSFILYETPL